MFHGSIVALVTPFLQDAVDIDTLRELVEYHIAAGTDGIVAAGTTGESGTLGHAEKLAVIQAVVEQAGDRIPVIAGTAANATRDCIELTRAAMSLGADAALIMAPAYIKPTQDGLYRHYATVAQAAALPIILYNVPGRTACDILPETVAKLAKISNIVGIKDATADITRLHDLQEMSGSNLDIFSGDDATAALWMLEGAKGVISVSANVVPERIAKMCADARDGNREACLVMHASLRALHEYLFVEANPIPVKWILAHLGKISDEMRMPLTPLSEQYHRTMLELIEALTIV